VTVTTEQYNAARTLLKIRAAKDDFLTFCQIISPDPNAPDDPDVSQFHIEPHHRLIGEALMKVQKGECLRLAISMPPQHGKSEQISRLFPAWFMGKQPWKNLMFGTYSQDFANDFGAHVRARMQHPRYAMVFPGVELRKDSTAKDYQVTTAGGQMNFIGRGGGGTGKPADIFVIDDPIKAEDAASLTSDTVLKACNRWYDRTISTRVARDPARSRPRRRSRCLPPWRA